MPARIIFSSISADSVFGPMVPVNFVCLVGATTEGTLDSAAKKEKIAKRRDENYGHQRGQGGSFM